MSTPSKDLWPTLVKQETPVVPDPKPTPTTDAGSIFNLILQILTIAQIVGKVIQPFVTAGVPQAITKEHVTAKTTDLLNKAVSDGNVDKSVLNNHKEVIQAVIAANPDIKN